MGTNPYVPSPFGGLLTPPDPMKVPAYKAANSGKSGGVAPSIFNSSQQYGYLNPKAVAQYGAGAEAGAANQAAAQSQAMLGMPQQSTPSTYMIGSDSGLNSLLETQPGSTGGFNFAQDMAKRNANSSPLFFGGQAYNTPDDSGDGGFSPFGLPAYQYQPFTKKLSDYIDGDGSNLIAGQLDALNQERKGGRKQVDTSSANIGAVYAALQNAIGKTGATSASQYKQGEHDTQAAQDAATSAIMAAAKSSGGNVDATLKNLGIAGSNAGQKQTQAEYTTNGVRQGAQGTAAAVQNLVANGQAMQNYYAGSKNAAGLEGANQQSNLEDQYTSYLSQLAGQENTLRDNAQQQAIANGQTAFNAAQNAWGQQQAANEAQNNTTYSRDMDAYNAQIAANAATAKAQSQGTGGAGQVALQSALPNDQQGQAQVAHDISSALSSTDPNVMGYYDNGKKYHQYTAFQRGHKAIENLPPELQAAALAYLTATLGTSNAGTVY